MFLLSSIYPVVLGTSFYTPSFIQVDDGEEEIYGECEGLPERLAEEGFIPPPERPRTIEIALPPPGYEYYEYEEAP